MTGTSTGQAAFVELFNSCATPVNVEGWRLIYRDPDKAGASLTTPDYAGLVATLQGTMPPNGYLVYAGPGNPMPSTGPMIGGIGKDGAVGLRDASGQLRDSVGYGAVPLGGFTEGSPVPKPPAGVSIARVPNGRDTNQNSTDFREAPLTPGKPTPLATATPLVTTTYSYTYDNAGRLEEVRDKTNSRLIGFYAYDANGNRIYYTNLDSQRGGGGSNATYDSADHLLQYGRFTYSWSPNGDLLTKTNTNDGTITRYSYDLLGNLTGVALPDGKQITYVIDGRNRRIAKLVNGMLIRKWLYQDGLRPIAELNSNNDVVQRFVYATGRNVPDYFISHGATYRIITDQLGSPRLVVNIATGEIAQRIDYDEFGKVISDSKPGSQPFGFAGGLYDSDTGLVRFGARDYDAFTGRWTNRDPIGFAGGDTNLYAYVGNDPVNLIDPLGLSWQRMVKVIALSLGLFNKHMEGVARDIITRAQKTEEIERLGKQMNKKRKTSKEGLGPLYPSDDAVCLIPLGDIWQVLADIDGNGVIDEEDALEWLNPSWISIPELRRMADELDPFRELPPNTIY